MLAAFTWFADSFTLPSRCHLVGAGHATRNEGLTRGITFSRTLSQRSLVPLKSVEEATRTFWVFFVFGNGGLTVGFAQLPRLYKSLKTGFALAGRESLGGPALAVPHSLLLYPEAIRVTDLDAVINAASLSNLDKVVAQGPQDTYVQQRGYLTFPAFEQALYRERPTLNPLAVRVVFDAFFKTQDSVDPVLAYELLAKWRDEGSTGSEGASFAKDIIGAKLGNYVPLATFAFLLWLILDIIVENGMMAYFPS